MKTGELHYPIMGCYGIGVGRLAASVCEESHDEYGPVCRSPSPPGRSDLRDCAPIREEPKRIGEELYLALEKSRRRHHS
jgi:prolyl-tRNA synthetase